MASIEGKVVLLKKLGTRTARDETGRMWLRSDIPPSLLPQSHTCAGCGKQLDPKDGLEKWWNGEDWLCGGHLEE